METFFGTYLVNSTVTKINHFISCLAIVIFNFDLKHYVIGFIKTWVVLCQVKLPDEPYQDLPSKTLAIKHFYLHYTGLRTFHCLHHCSLKTRDFQDQMLHSLETKNHWYLGNHQALIFLELAFIFNYENFINDSQNFDPCFYDLT